MRITESQIQKVIQKILKEDAGMDTPGGNPDYFYDEDSIFSKTKGSGMSTEETVKVLWEIQKLLSEGAPAIALRRVVELLEDMGEDVEFSDGRYETQIDEQAEFDFAQIPKGFTNTDRKILNRIYDAVGTGGAAGGFKGGRKRAVPSLGTLPSL